jgi:hypothetical protein
VKRRLQRLLDATPVDRDAEERVWQVVHAAYAEREPVRRRRRPRYVVAFAALAVAVAAAALSPPGRAVVDAVRRSIGVEHAAPALFRLPAPGRLLVSGPGGAWIVSADGSKRRLGDYTQASWSPHSLYVVAAAANELAALDPGGKVRWSLARAGARAPAWGGSRTDTRVSYLSRGRLHVVGGNGAGDRTLDVRSSSIAPQWRPGDRRQLAIVTPAGRVVLYDADADKIIWRTRAFAHPRALAWSPSGVGLALATATRLVLVRDGQATSFEVAGIRAIAISRYDLAYLRGNVVSLFNGRAEPRRLFTAPGRLAGLAWSPNGRWLATTLPSADQLIFVGRRVTAVSNIRAQLGGPVTLDGWAPGT